MVAAVACLSFLLVACETTAADRSAVVSSINASRAAAGVPGLRENAELNNKADAWAVQMRDQCRIWHSRLSDGAPAGWRKLGENVGRGRVHRAGAPRLHELPRAPPQHPRSVLQPGRHRSGVGHLRRAPHGLHRPRVHAPLITVDPAGTPVAPGRGATLSGWRSHSSSSSWRTSTGTPTDPAGCPRRSPGSARRSASSPRRSARASIDEQLHELGDVLAWVASLANQLGLSLDDAAQRYVIDPPA